MAWPSPPLDVKPVAGFHGTKVESIAVAANGTRLFAGSSDGSLVIYDCRRDTPDAVRSGSVELKQITQLAAGSADGSRRPSITGALGGSSKSTAVSGLTVVDAWRMLLGLVDGQLVAYDVNTCRKIAELPETKGALLLSVHPTSQRVVVVTKKKQLLTYAYQGGPTGVGIGGGYAPPLARVPNDAPDAEFSCVLPDVPLCVCLCGSSASQGTVNSVLHLSLMVVLGYKKHYELKDLASGQTTRLLDTDRPGIAPNQQRLQGCLCQSSHPQRRHGGTPHVVCSTCTCKSASPLQRWGGLLSLQPACVHFDLCFADQSPPPVPLLLILLWDAWRN